MRTAPLRPALALGALASPLAVLAQAGGSAAAGHAPAVPWYSVLVIGGIVGAVILAWAKSVRKNRELM